MGLSELLRSSGQNDPIIFYLRMALNRSLSPLPLFFHLFALPEAVCRPALLLPLSCRLVSPGRRRPGEPRPSGAGSAVPGTSNLLWLFGAGAGSRRGGLPVPSLPRGAGGCRLRRAPRPRAAGRPWVFCPLPGRPAPPRDRLSCCPLRPWPPRGLPGGMPPACA